jgi:hypothetical protein
MELSRRMVLLDDTAAMLRMIRAELASLDKDQESAVSVREPETPRVPLQAEGRARVA